MFAAADIIWRRPLRFHEKLVVNIRLVVFVGLHLRLPDKRSVVRLQRTSMPPAKDCKVDKLPVATVITLRRLKLALLASIIVPTVLFVAGTWNERTELLISAENEAKADVASLREHVLKTIETNELLLREVDHRIEGLNWAEIQASAVTLSNDIGAMHANMPQVALVDVSDTNGIVQAGTPPRGTNEHRSVAYQEFWSAQRDADQGTFFSRAYVGRRTGVPGFGISRRRSAPDGKFDGTIHVAVRASYFTNFWSEVISGKDGAVISLIRMDGEMLARFPAALPLSRGPGPRLALLVSHFPNELQGGVYRRPSLTDGVDRIYAYARIGSFPLVVRYSLPVDTILAPWRLHVVILGTCGALAAAAVALALLVVIRQVHKVIDEQTRRAEIEEAARKGQRMELLGQLSAGTAHDLANILQAMQIGATLIARRAEDPERIRSLASRLGEDAARGASLTHRMLDLVRRNHTKEDGQADPSESMKPAEVISDVSNLLSRILGAKHRLRSEVALEGKSLFIRGNRTDFEVALINLAVNARDAMPDGGEVVIQAASEHIGGPVPAARPKSEKKYDPSTPPAVPGLYLRVSVIDRGVGMTKEVLARAGERFFTTKPSGQGTGLGLPGVRAFALQIGGKLTIESEAGFGTTASLWLPAFLSDPTSSPAEAETVA